MMIYTIGYGHRSGSEFSAILKKFRVEYVLDVRSKPYSKWNEAFDKRNIKATLSREGLKYHYFGDKLGGIPSHQGLYDEHGKTDYEQLRLEPYFQEGILRLLGAIKKQIPVALMCAEQNPITCHRVKLIGRELLQHHNYSLRHIIAEGKIKSQEQVTNEITKGRGDRDLFS